MSQKKLPLVYRPVQLKQIVGQKHIVATLIKSAEKNKFADAYLFCGEKGSGKTSMARIVATLMTCTNVVNGEACGKCRACQTISQSASSDVKEINGADKRKVEDIRSLIESAYWSPQELARKIYIIDECHQLTKEAWSALLKIIEEPPSYLTFIFCTTEPKKMLPTILSRCQKFVFHKILSKDIAGRLRLIADKEQLRIDDVSISLIAKMARGSMRDAIVSLEQIGNALPDEAITEKHIRELFCLSDRVGIMEIVKAIKAGNIAVLLDQVNDMIMAGVDVKDIMFEISEVFRNIILLKIQKGTKVSLIDLPDNEIEELKKIGESMDLNGLLKLARLFSDIDNKIAFNINERWIMETTLINCVATLSKK